jgi:hypothetical protein
MIDYKQQENILLEDLYTYLKAAEYLRELKEKAKTKEQYIAYSKAYQIALGRVSNDLFLLDWNQEKQSKENLANLDIEKELDTQVITEEPILTRALVPKGWHRSFGSVLIKDKEREE